MQHFAAVKRKLSDDYTTTYSLFALSVFSELSFWGVASTLLDLHIPSFQSPPKSRSSETNTKSGDVAAEESYCGWDSAAHCCVPSLRGAGGVGESAVPGRRAELNL